jgi:hypothetical protein
VRDLYTELVSLMDGQTRFPAPREFQGENSERRELPPGVQVHLPKTVLNTGYGLMESTLRVNTRDGFIKPFICTVTREEHKRRCDRRDAQRADVSPHGHVPGCYRLFSRGRPAYYRQIHRACPYHFSLRAAP